MTDLRDRWPLPGRPGLRDRLLAAYGDGRRGYHDLTHLAEVLDHVATLADAADDLEAVVLAAWFHDAVYDGDRRRRGAVRRAGRPRSWPPPGVDRTGSPRWPGWSG